MKAIFSCCIIILVSYVDVKAFSSDNGLVLRMKPKTASGESKNFVSESLFRKQRASSSGTSLALSSVTGIYTVQYLPSMALACLIPSLLGYYKSEYGVSYAYGIATATSAILALKQIYKVSSSFSSIAGVHAFALLAYGIRLSLFLLYREIKIPRFRKFREKIEDRANSKGSRLSRTPFILGVSFLYYCLAIPITTSTALLHQVPYWSLGGGIKLNLVRVLVGTTWLGFILAMVGDTTKTVVKGKEGEDYLVTQGVFDKFRHPNYTGEIFGWTASALVGCLVGGIASKAASIVGAMGIDFVLVQAATSLERRQKEKYGESKKYQDWIQGSWAGVTMKTKQSMQNDTTDASLLTDNSDTKDGA